MTPADSYFHGGAPGLRAGDWITPRDPADTRHYLDDCPTCRARAAGTPLPDDDLDPSLVYVTGSRQYARLFAGGYPRGALYRVRPEGPLTPSPDPEWTQSFGCPRAQILAVLDPLVILTAREIRRVQRLLT